MPNLRKKEYEERLNKLKLTTLEKRRKRGDLIEFFKIIKVFDQVRWKKLPEKIVQGDEDGPAASNLRKGVTFFRGELANICTSRREFFLNRVIPLWNELPQKVRKAVTLNSFKAELGKMKLFLT